MKETEKTLRDEFAMALACAWLQTYGSESHPVITGSETHFAKNAYRLADAMLAERMK